MSCNKTIVNNYNYNCPTKTKYPCGCIAIIDTGCIDYYGVELPKIGVEANTHTTLKDILQGINDAISCYFLTPEESSTVAISIEAVDPIGSPCDYKINANVKLSSDSGNALEARADGLYATAGGAAQEGLTFIQSVNASYSNPGFQIWTVLQPVPYPNTSSVVITSTRATDYSYITRNIEPLSQPNIYGFVSWSVPSSGLTGQGLNLILLHNDEIIWSTTLVDFSSGTSGILPIPIPLPSTGTLMMSVTENRFDTNGPDSQQGILTVGGEYVDGGYYTVDLVLNGGGAVGSTPVYWPNQQAAEQNYIDYKTINYSSQATDGVITINKTPDRGVMNVKIDFKVSVDSSLNFTETVLANTSYSRTIPLTLAQLNNNDFMLTITPV